MDEFDQRFLKSQLKQIADSHATDDILRTLATIYSERASNCGPMNIQQHYLFISTGLTHLTEQVLQRLQRKEDG